MRQIPESEVQGSFEPIADLSARARSVLEDSGVVFEEETEFDEPGPTQWAAVQLHGGQQYLVIHHYAHPRAFIELLAPVGTGSPATLTTEFAISLQLEADVTWVADGWPHSPAP